MKAAMETAFPLHITTKKTLSQSLKSESSLVSAHLMFLKHLLGYIVSKHSRNIPAKVYYQLFQMYRYILNRFFSSVEKELERGQKERKDSFVFIAAHSLLP